jgi:ABC-type lipoprotein export system ATPase subunit
LRDINLDIAEAELCRSWDRLAQEIDAVAHPRDTITDGRANSLNETAVHHLNRKSATLRVDQIGFVFRQCHCSTISRFENLEIRCRIATIAKRARRDGGGHARPVSIVGKRICIRVSYPADNSNSRGYRAIIAEPKLLLADEPTETCTPVRVKKSWSCFASSTAKE